MKRSPALAALSRDHHHALVIARRLGRARLEQAPAATADFVTFMRGEGLEHFRIEEQLLLPAVPSTQEGRALVAQVLAEHRELRRAAERLADTGRTPDLEELHKLGSMLRSHVRAEERRLFPCLEVALDDDQLCILGERVEAAEAASA